MAGAIAVGLALADTAEDLLNAANAALANRNVNLVLVPEISFDVAGDHGILAFIEGRIGFLDMAAIVEDVLSEMIGSGHTNAEISLDNVLDADHLARVKAAEIIERRRQA